MKKDREDEPSQGRNSNIDKPQRVKFEDPNKDVAFDGNPKRNQSDSHAPKTLKFGGHLIPDLKSPPKLQEQ